MKNNKNICILLASILISVILAEIVLRTVLPDPYSDSAKAANELVEKYERGELNVSHVESSNPLLMYKLRSNTSKVVEWYSDWKKRNITVRTNSFGIRDKEYDLQKKTGVFRIIVLGDSVTFGNALQENETYPKILEELLNAEHSNKKFEVMNFGVSGYNTRQEIELLKETGLMLKPDLVIVGYVLNDVEPSRSVFNLTSPDPQEILGPENCYVAFLKLPMNCDIKKSLKKSKLLQLTKEVFSKLFYLLGFNKEKEVNDEYILKLHNKNDTLEQVSNAFKDFLQLSKDNNFTPITVMFPLIVDLNKYKFFSAHEKILSINKELGINALDLFETYKKHDLLDVQLNKDDILHYNPQGHKLAAESIKIFLEEKKIIH